MDDDGNCILKEKCPLVCPKENQEFRDCGTNCGNRCSDPVDIVCAAVCSPGCYCKDGYKLDDDGNCILEDECSNNNDVIGLVCPKENQKWYDCEGSDSDDIICSTVCSSGCYCKNGYKLDNDGNCILENECSNNNVCPKKNQKWYDCEGSDSDDIVCATVCSSGCYCKNGYKLDNYGNCILENQCP